MKENVSYERKLYIKYLVIAELGGNHQITFEIFKKIGVIKVSGQLI